MRLEIILIALLLLGLFAHIELNRETFTQAGVIAALK